MYKLGKLLSCNSIVQQVHFIIIFLVPFYYENCERYGVMGDSFDPSGVSIWVVAGSGGWS